MKKNGYDSMNINLEYVDSFDDKYDYWMRVEHLGRYLWACDILKDKENVLDIACANGYGTSVLSNSVGKVFGLDRNEEYIKIAKNKYNKENIEYIKFDVDNERIKDKYDAIVCFETLEHVKYPKKLLNNLYQCLNKNGTLLLSVPNSKYEVIENGKNKDSFHLNIFEYNELINLIKNEKFKIEKILGQSYTNKIVNNLIPEINKTDIFKDAVNVGYPNEIDISYTYSYIFLLKK